jgi:hypothetical protein
MKMNNIALASLLVIVSGAALPGVSTASITVAQSNVPSWVENLTGLAMLAPLAHRRINVTKKVPNEIHETDW